MLGDEGRKFRRGCQSSMTDVLCGFSYGRGSLKREDGIEKIGDGGNCFF